jgi:hypothetical protein
MNNLTTLSCPSCGATLEVASGVKQLSCKYCGNIHVFSDTVPGIDANGAVCPIGLHQDLVQKVSTVINNQVFDSDAVSEPEKHITYRSQLARKLTYPPKPVFPLAVLTTRSGTIIYVLIPVLIFAYLGNILVSYFYPASNICGFILFLVIGFSVAIPLAKLYLGPMFNKKYLEFLGQYKQWESGKNLWDNSYYCQRHDIVFEKGSEKAIPIDNFKSFLLNKE